MIKLNPKAKWTQFSHPDFPGKWYKWGDLAVCVTQDDGLWHLSISCRYRYPTWSEIYSAWYDLVPGAGKDFNGAILLPRHSEYVNVHANTFHVRQLHDAEVPAGIIL